MAEYKLKKNSEGVVDQVRWTSPGGPPNLIIDIFLNSGSRHERKYLAWKAAGNTPDSSD